MNINRITEIFGNYTYQNVTSMENYIDIDFISWLIWLFTPVFIAFLLPIIILIMAYVSAMIIHLFRLRNKLREIRQDCAKGDYWQGARKTIAVMWDAHGWIYHGYEIEGLENIPDDGPALIIYYHGAIPLDYYYLLAKVLLYKQRLIRAVGDKFLFSIPGWKLMMEVFHVFPGTLQTCTHVLENGELLSIAPGGVREALFSDNNYSLVWGNRIGFAKVAYNAKVPIIPVFTVNIREAFRSVQLFKSWFEHIYEKLRLPIVPIYGNFPVKMKTIIGKPIEYDPNITPEQLAIKTSRAIEQMIEDNQRLPGNILRAIFDRIHMPPKKKQ